MSSKNTSYNQIEWVKVLDKGIVTLPKKMRDKLGIKSGDITQARVSGNSIIISTQNFVEGVREYSQEDLSRWEKGDTLSPELLKKYRDLLDDLI